MSAVIILSTSWEPFLYFHPVVGNRYFKVLTLPLPLLKKKKQRYRYNYFKKK